MYVFSIYIYTMVIWYAIPAPQQGTELVSVLVVTPEYIM